MTQGNNDGWIKAYRGILYSGGCGIQRGPVNRPHNLKASSPGFRISVKLWRSWRDDIDYYVTSVSTGKDAMGPFWAQRRRR